MKIDEGFIISLSLHMRHFKTSKGHWEAGSGNDFEAPATMELLMCYIACGSLVCHEGEDSMFKRPQKIANFHIKGSLPTV